MKPLNSGNRRVLKKLTVIDRCPLLGGNFKKRLSHLGLIDLSTIQGISAIWDVRYWDVSLYLLNLLNGNSMKVHVIICS